MTDGIFWNERTFEAAKLLEGALSGDRKDKNAFFEALVTTDLPAALTPALNKKVLDEYERIPVAWEAFAERELVDDFRPQEVARMGLTGDGIPASTSGEEFVPDILPRVEELGEYPLLGIRGSDVSFKTQKNGVRFALSWESIVNNRDLRLIERAISKFASMSREKEEYLATWQYVTSSGINTANLTSGALGTNDNLLSGNPVLSAASLEDAWIQATQHEIDGQRIRMPARMNLIVPSALAFEAERILSRNVVTDLPGSGGGVAYEGPNPLSGRFDVVVNDWFSVLDSTNGATTWMIAPKPGAFDMGGAALAFLRGHENPRYFVRNTHNGNPADGDFDLDAYETKVRHIVGPAWRGINAGIVISNGSKS